MIPAFDKYDTTPPPSQPNQSLRAQENFAGVRPYLFFAGASARSARERPFCNHPPPPTQPSQNVAFHITALFLRYEYQFVCTLCQASHIETWLTCDTFSILYEKPSHLHLHLSKLSLQLAATNCRSWGASAATKKSNDYKGKHCDPRTLSLDLHFRCDDGALRGSEGWHWNVERTLLVYSAPDELSIGVLLTCTE